MSNSIYLSTIGLMVGFLVWPSHMSTAQEVGEVQKISIKRYQEAPMLAERVRGGELPPVDERLPEEPLVIKPLEEIGQYGGTWHRMMTPGNLKTETFFKRVAQ